MLDTKIKETLWTIHDACAFMQCSRSFLYKIARAGDLKSIKIGNCWRFREQDVKEWANSQAEQEV